MRVRFPADQKLFGEHEELNLDANGHTNQKDRTTYLFERRLIAGIPEVYGCWSWGRFVDVRFKAGSHQYNALVDHFILEAPEPMLFMDSIHATRNVYGYKSAIDRLERLMDYVRDAHGHEIPELDSLHAGLYREWTSELLRKGDIPNALLAFETGSAFYPEDTELRLLGVEVALADSRLNQAETLMNQTEYPSGLRDRVRLLTARIKALRAEEEKITIRFSPRSRQIPVTAILNRDVEQRFLIDTGASLVSIPSGTLRSLDIEIDSRNPMRSVSGIGGVKRAPEITISEITLNGWVEYNVRAVVLDIPNQPGLGLLGLNFLQRFNVELNQEQGELMLKPR